MSKSSSGLDALLSFYFKTTSPRQFQVKIGTKLIHGQETMP